MEKRIITVAEELRVDDKKLILVNKEKAFLTDANNPYFSAINKKTKQLIFCLWEQLHYGILRSNILCVIEGRIGKFTKSVLMGIDGIVDEPFSEGRLTLLVENDDYDKVKAKECIRKKEDEDVEEIHGQRPHMGRVFASDYVASFPSDSVLSASVHSGRYFYCSPLDTEWRATTPTTTLADEFFTLSAAEVRQQMGVGGSQQ